LGHDDPSGDWCVFYTQRLVAAEQPAAAPAEIAREDDAEREPD
jgi:hypothetical protein